MSGIKGRFPMPICKDCVRRKCCCRQAGLFPAELGEWSFMNIHKSGRLRIFIAAVSFCIFFAGCREGESISVSESSVLSAEAETDAGESRDSSPVSHPLSVPGMRERNYSAVDLTLLNVLPAEEGLYAREFSYVSDGYKVYGLIERPKGSPPEGGWPVILLAHGHIPPE